MIANFDYVYLKGFVDCSVREIAAELQPTKMHSLSLQWLNAYLLIYRESRFAESLQGLGRRLKLRTGRRKFLKAAK